MALNKKNVHDEFLIYASGGGGIDFLWRPYWNSVEKILGGRMAWYLLYILNYLCAEFDTYLYLYVTWQYALLCYRAMGAIAPHCGFSGVSPDGNCAYVH